jgi:hypothetical protein
MVYLPQSTTFTLIYIMGRDKISVILKLGRRLEERKGCLSAQTFFCKQK